MINIPDTNSFEEFVRNKMGVDLPALKHAYQSYKLGRSTNSASILLLGMSGSGKSHTINTLFKNHITAVNEEKSCTKEIIEFTIDFPSEDVGILNSKIHVIDTPGFGDTNYGMKFDANVIITIRRFFEKKQYKPNFIILVVNITETRLDGKFSNFVKLLQSMRLQFMKNVLDSKTPNIVVVLTHLCSLTPKLRKDPTSKITLVKNIVHQYLGIPNVPVEVAENDIEAFNLKKIKGYYELPNKELYPRNLYLSLVRIAKDKDLMGHGLVNEAYRKLYKGKINISSQSYEILEDKDADVLVTYIMQMQVSENSELTKSLIESWAQLSPSDRNLSRLEPNEFGQKLSILGYKKIKDLPRGKSDLNSFFRELAPDEGMEILIRKSFGLEPQHLTVDLFVGRAFDLTKDRTTTFNVMSTGPPSLAPVGCYVPKHIQATDCPEVKFTCHVADTAEDMIKQRLSELKIQFSSFNFDLNFAHRDGYNTFLNKSGNTLTAVYEKKLLKLEIKHDAEISPELISAVENLPCEYNNQDHNNIQQWKNFFNSYGTHYISTSYVGGSVVFKLSDIGGSIAKPFTQVTQGGLSGFLHSIFGSIDGHYSSSKDSSLSLHRKNVEIVVYGGNSSKASILSSSENPKEFKDRFSDWEETIWDNPVVSDLNIVLAEVADVVNKVRPEVVIAMKNAAEDLYHANFKKTNPRSPPSREEDSAANKNSSGSNCITPQTLISTLSDSVPVMSLQAGDFVLDKNGLPARVIGVNKVFALSNTTLYGFRNDVFSESKPFFTSGHTFLTSSGDILVQNRTILEMTHPQMKTEFSVVEMPSENIEIAIFTNGKIDTCVIPGLTTHTISEGEELYYLVVEGDGSYVANSFVCYHELPHFRKWPKTFAAIFEIINYKGLVSHSEKHDLTYEQFQDLVKISEQIKMKWENMVKELRDRDLDKSATENFESIWSQLGSVLSNGYRSALGMILYSRCGEFLHRCLDVDQMSILPFVKEAQNVFAESIN